jgi:hypothetical protein
MDYPRSDAEFQSWGRGGAGSARCVDRSADTPSHPFDAPPGEDPVVGGQEIDQAWADLAGPVFIPFVHRSAVAGIHRAMSVTV